MLKWASNVIAFQLRGRVFFHKEMKHKPNEAGLKFYDAVIDECLSYNIEPVITISHYEMPLHLAKRIRRVEKSSIS